MLVRKIGGNTFVEVNPTTCTERIVGLSVFGLEGEQTPVEGSEKQPALAFAGLEFSAAIDKQHCGPRTVDLACVEDPGGLQAGEIGAIDFA